jgi:hypothetical protein
MELLEECFGFTFVMLALALFSEDVCLCVQRARNYKENEYESHAAIYRREPFTRDAQIHDV